jgi:hypothetical protein
MQRAFRRAIRPAQFTQETGAMETGFFRFGAQFPNLDTLEATSGVCGPPGAPNREPAMSGVRVETGKRPGLKLVRAARFPA